jgi:protein TonB
MDRRLPIVIAVVGFHVLGLWALQAGLLHRAVELVVPVSVLSEVIEPPQPQRQTTPPPPQTRPALAAKAAPTPQPVAQPTPLPVAVATATPSPQAPVGVVEPQAPAPVAAHVVADAATAAPPAPPAPPTPAKVEQPFSDADYLNNPKPPYPTLSVRLGEQGTVVVRALVEPNGSVSKIELKTSSGFERLDQAALKAVSEWRFVPGKRGGVPEPMFVVIPIPFRLTK